MLEKQKDFHNLEAKYLNKEIFTMIKQEEKYSDRSHKRIVFKKKEKKVTTEEDVLAQSIQAGLQSIDTHGKFSLENDQKLKLPDQESKGTSGTDSEDNNT